MMSDTEKPKRVIDRERQWRKLDAGHYVSPKGRFHARRDDVGDWWLVDTEGELPVEPFTRWKDARATVEAIEFPPVAPETIELLEDEIRDEFHDVFIITLRRSGKRIGDVVVRRGGVIEPAYPGSTITPEEAEAFATALMLATHRAAQLDREEA